MIIIDMDAGHFLEFVGSSMLNRTLCCIGNMLGLGNSAFNGDGG